MWDRFWHRLVNLLLSAIVLAWGFVPPGVQHVHAGGGDPEHRHDGHDELAQEHPHDHQSDDAHHSQASESDLSPPEDYVLHLHWRLLGVEFAMPVSEASDEANGDTFPLAFVRMVSEDVVATQTCPSFDRVLPSVTSMHGLDVVRNSDPVPRPPNLVTSIPLCESARFERSGVLRA